MRRKIGTTILTPWLAASRGWRSVPYLYAGATAVFTALWCAFAANTPQEWRGPPHMNEPEIALLEAGVKGQAKKSGRGIPWYLFKVGAANAIILSHIAANATEYTLTQWAPTFFIEQHGVSPAQLGQFLALPQTAAFAATFVTAALEDLALRSGMALLTVRKIAGLGGSILHAICLLAFGLGARQSPPYSQDLPLLPLHGP